MTETATFVKNIRKHIFLQPKDKQNINKAVKMTLLQDKKKYSDRLSGALLDVSNIKVVGNSHLVVEGYLSMEVRADFHIFCPKPGSTLNGVVNKCSKTHLGCLVMNTFNASLAVTSNSDRDPHEGDLCTFKVTEVVVDGEIMFVRGVLLSCEPGPDSISPDSIIKPNKSKIFADEEKEEPAVEVKVEKEDPAYSVPPSLQFSAINEKSSNEGSEKKKKKKRKSILDIETEVVVKKEKKSPKKHKS